MSEINSIAQGTYTLGQTSATTYQAGPGISITQPSEGTVRIGNDETVLFESTSNTGNSAMSFSEPLSSFDKIRVEAYQVAVGFWGSDELISLSDTTYGAGFVRFASGNNPCQIGGCILTVNSSQTSGTITSKGRHWFPTTTAAGGGDTNQFCFTKVVGINRKEV